MVAVRRFPQIAADDTDGYWVVVGLTFFLWPFAWLLYAFVIPAYLGIKLFQSLDKLADRIT